MIRWEQKNHSVRAIVASMIIGIARKRALRTKSIIEKADYPAPMNIVKTH